MQRVRLLIAVDRASGQANPPDWTRTIERMPGVRVVSRDARGVQIEASRADAPALTERLERELGPGFHIEPVLERRTMPGPLPGRSVANPLLPPTQKSAMTSPETTTSIPPGWKGGFPTSNPAFAYPDPDLSSLPMLGNLENIDLLQRQQKVLWPEFSWETVPGEPDSRCFQMFAPDISRLGYTDEGRVYSIICPQQGACSPSLGCLNVEVTVTGNRGWADEPNKDLAADMTVEARLWFSPSAHQNKLVQFLWHVFSQNDLPFPSDKANAIRITTHKAGDPSQPIFDVRRGETTKFESPPFARHEDVAYTVGHLEVEIGPIKPSGSKQVDEFNALVLQLFNAASGNMLHEGNVLTWNVWFNHPELVDQQEWRGHAEKWRKSIDADHGSPGGSRTPARFFDGTAFQPVEAFVGRELGVVLDWLKKHL